MSANSNSTVKNVNIIMFDVNRTNSNSIVKNVNIIIFGVNNRIQTLTLTIMCVSFNNYYDFIYDKKS